MGNQQWAALGECFQPNGCIFYRNARQSLQARIGNVEGEQRWGVGCDGMSQSLEHLLGQEVAAARHQHLTGGELAGPGRVLYR